MAFRNPNEISVKNLSKELQDRVARYTPFERPSDWYGKPVENLPSSEMEQIHAKIAEESDAYRKNAAELEAKRKAEEEAEKAKEQELLAEAQKVADSLPHVGTKGAPSADSVRRDLMQRIGQAITDAIDKSRVTLTRNEDGTYVARHGDDTIHAFGEIEENKSAKGKTSYAVTAYRFGHEKETKSKATFPSREEAEWFIKGMAAEAPGKAVIGVPGDGVYTLNRSGKALLGTWVQARGIDTSSTKSLPVGLTKKAKEGYGGGIESPPESPRTKGEWEETKNYFGLNPTDKIADYSAELRDFAEKVGQKIDKAPEKITSQDVDQWINETANKKTPPGPSMGPGAAAAAEFGERPPDPEVLGLSAGNPIYNRLERQAQNLFSGIKQLWKRVPTKQDFMQWVNAADNIPRQAGLEAGNSIRKRAPKLEEQNALTALAQSLKAAGDGLEPEAQAGLEFANNPQGWLRQVETDMETKAQEFLNNGQKLEAQAAIDERNAARYARDHFNELRPIVELGRRKFDRQHMRLANAGIDVNYENWYVPQRHDLDLFSGANRPIVLGHSRGSGASTGFKKAKVYENYAEAIENGFIPRSLSYADLLEHYVSTTERQLTYRSLFSALGEVNDEIDGKPIATKIPRRVITRADGTTDVQETVPIGYSIIDVLPGVRMAIHDGYARLARALTASSQISESALVGGAQDLAAIEKHLMLALDTFHASRTLQSELALTGKASLPGTERLKRGVALVEMNPADLDVAVRNGEITQEIADSITQPKPVEVGGRQIELSSRNIWNLALKSGLNAARVADAMYRDWLKEVPVLGTVNKWVFEKMTRSAMAQSFESEFIRQAKAHPELSAKRVGLKVARDINVMFGNLQKESFVRNPSFRAINQIVFLAPQWVEALARREGRFAWQLGKAGVGLARGEGLRLGTVGRGIGTGLAAYFVATQLVNLMTRGHLTFSNKEEGHKLDAWLPFGPRGMFVSPLSVFGEIAHDIIRLSFSKDDLFQVGTQIAANKFGNLGRFLEVVTTGRDPLTGEKVVGTARRALKAGAQLIPVPITASGAVKELGAKVGIGQAPPPGAWARQAASSAGFKMEPAPSAAQQMREAAKEWSLKQGGKIQAEAERRLTEDFGPSAYRDLRTALDRNDPKAARRAYNNLRQEGKTPAVIRQTIEHPHPFAGSASAEAKFKHSLTPEQKRIYEEALADRRETTRRFRHMLSETK